MNLINSLALPIPVDSLLRGHSVEWERLEFKAGWNAEAVLRTICAFANDFHNLGGGYILIGVDEENGRPKLPPRGIAESRVDSIQKKIPEMGHSAIRPMYHPVTAPQRVGGRTVLVIWVPGGETRPYKAKTSLSGGSSQWAWYIRKQSSTVRAVGADERELLSLAATVPFDDRYNQRASIDDLSLKLVGEFLTEVGSGLADRTDGIAMETLGRRMNIIGGPPESAFPKNVGLMFFNHDPASFFPATQIDVVWFPDGPGGDRFEEKMFKGPLPEMTRGALEYIQRGYLKETVVKRPERAEADRFWNYPYAAVEEAVVNAVYHRSYEIREPVEVRITPEELSVLSYPGPDRSVGIEDLRAGRAVNRRYRNRRIGEFLKELNLAEGRSTGIPKILKAMSENGSPAPVFETDEDRSYFLIRFPAHPSVPGKSGKASGGRGAHEEAHEEAHDDSGIDLSVTERRILSACGGGPQKASELLGALGYKSRTGNFKKSLNRLLDSRILERTLGSAPRSRNQRYRLTAFGEKILASTADPER